MFEMKKDDCSRLEDADDKLNDKACEIFTLMVNKINEVLFIEMPKAEKDIDKFDLCLLVFEKIAGLGLSSTIKMVRDRGADPKMLVEFVESIVAESVKVSSMGVIKYVTGESEVRN